jgi:hypothetical protein
MDGFVIGRVDLWSDGWIYGQMDGFVIGRVDLWSDGWICDWRV